MRSRRSRGLLESSVGPATLKSYRVALASFLAWLQEEGVVRVGGFDYLDDLLSEYFDHLFVSLGRKGRQQAANTRSAVLLFLPNGRWALNCSARALKGWARLRPSKQRPPMPWDLATILVDQFRRDNLLEYKWILRACFEGYLRLSEAVGVKLADLDVSGQEGILALPKSKTGLNQSVVIHRGDWLELTRRLLKRRPAHQPSLVSVSAQSFRSALKKALKNLGVSRVSFTPHSLRHGGATRDYMLGVPMADIVVRGRWAQSKTASRYIQQGRALLVKLDLPKKLRGKMRRISAQMLAEPKLGVLGMLPPRKKKTKQK